MLVVLDLLQGLDFSQSLVGDSILQTPQSHLLQSHSLSGLTQTRLKAILMDICQCAAKPTVTVIIVRLSYLNVLGLENDTMGPFSDAAQDTVLLHWVYGLTELFKVFSDIVSFYLL